MTAETGRLYRPCLCKGSNAVHVRCLQQWRAMAPNPERCESCHYRYRLQRERLAVVMAHPATCALLTAALASGGLFVLAEAVRIARRQPRIPLDSAAAGGGHGGGSGGVVLHSLQRMWRAAEVLASSLAVSWRRRSMFEDSSLLHAMQTGDYDSRLQRNDALVETLVTGGFVLFELYRRLRTHTALWLANSAEHVLPFNSAEEQEEKR